MIAELIPIWRRILTHPSVQTFEAEKSSANKDRTLFSVALAAIISAILVFVWTLVVASALASLGTLFGVPGAAAFGPIAAFKALIVNLVQTFVGFYLFCYLLQYVARQFFGGRGIFDEQAYLFAMVWAPVNIIAGLLMFVPCLGQLAAIVLGIYSLVLLTFAVQSGQGIAVGPAILSWLIAGIIVAIILFILGLLSGGWL